MSICKTTNGGISWPTRRFLGNQGNYSTFCRAIAVAPSNSSIVYAGCQENYYPKIYRSTDAGNTWGDISENLGEMLSRYDTIYAIWVSPYDLYKVLIGTPRGVFVSTIEGGTLNISWSPTPLEHSTYAFTYDQVKGILYAATNSGVYSTQDAGSSWRELNDGLGCLETLCIDIDSQNGLLFVGTDGGSVWRLDINPSDLDDNGIVNSGDFAIFASKWMDMCSTPDWCQGCDLNRSGKVDFQDLLNLVDQWLR